MKKKLLELTTCGIRIILGLIFLTYGLNGFFHFILMPPLDPKAVNFIGALYQTSYMLPLISGTEALVGLFLIAHLFVPLALVLLAPIIGNILAFHIFLDHEGLSMAMTLTLSYCFLLYGYFPYLKTILTLKAKPTFYQLFK